jgi:hypothetical protein
MNKSVDLLFDEEIDGIEVLKVKEDIFAEELETEELED